MWLEADGGKIINLEHVKEVRTEPIPRGSMLVAIFTHGDRGARRQFKAEQGALRVLRGHFINGYSSDKVLKLPRGQAPPGTPNRGQFRPGTPPVLQNRRSSRGDGGSRAE